MVIMETPIFTRRIKFLVHDDSYAALQRDICKWPGRGAIIPDSGGLRKLRWVAGGRGKRGGIRVIYYWSVSDDIIYMLLAYAKNEKRMTKDQLALLKQCVQQEFD